MAKNEEMLRKLRAGNHVENNGKVLDAINLLRHKYIDLKSVLRLQEGMGEQDFLVSVKFLQRAGYIHLRKGGVMTKLADYDYTRLEGIVSGKGIRLLAGEIQDDAVEVSAGLQQKFRASSFIRNTGRVLMDIDLLEQGYVKLGNVAQLYREFTEQEFLDCINYLQLERYIELQVVESKEPAQLADYEYTDLEACIGERGYRLLWGKTDDPLVGLG